MQFCHQRFPSSAVTDRSIYTLKNLFGIKSWRLLVTSVTVCIHKFNEIHAIVGEMPNCMEFSMQFYHQHFPSSALTDRSLYTLKNLFRINGWRPLATSATVWVYKSTENHAIVGQMPNCSEFSIQFYHQRFPSSALTDRSIYTLKNLFGINAWRPLGTSATVCVCKFNEIHAIVGEMPNCTNFSMQFYHQRFPSSALTHRSIYTLKYFFRIIGCGP